MGWSSPTSPRAKEFDKPLLGFIAPNCCVFYGWIVVSLAIVSTCCIHFGNLFINMLTMARVYVRSQPTPPHVSACFGMTFGQPRHRTTSRRRVWPAAA